MAETKYEQAALFEHRFWLQILGDHSRFIFNSLAPVEQEAIKEAHHFIQLFDRLLKEAREVAAAAQLYDLTKRAGEYAGNIRCFKLDLLRRQLTDKVVVSLSPTFISHMVNEVEEYLRILECLAAKEAPPLYHPLHHHLLWVPDAQGHAATLACGVDMVETDLKNTGEAFAAAFKELQLKAAELKGYLRAGEEEFPALFRYNCQVEKEILHFNEFLGQLFNLVRDKQALSTLTPLIPDHMLREECYFLFKLAQVSAVKPPGCDPTRPRFD